MTQARDTLLYFTGGGPLDGKAWWQSQVFGEEEMMPGADQYEDTATYKTSEKNPDLRARVWRLKQQDPSPVVASVGQKYIAETDPARFDLQKRRKAIKVSRSLVAERAGLNESKVAAIENGTGKRIKPEEVSALEAALTALESEAAARAHD